MSVGAAAAELQAALAAMSDEQARTPRGFAAQENIMAAYATYGSPGLAATATPQVAEPDPAFRGQHFSTHGAKQSEKPPQRSAAASQLLLPSGVQSFPASRNTATQYTMSQADAPQARYSQGTAPEPPSMARHMIWPPLPPGPPTPEPPASLQLDTYNTTPTHNIELNQARLLPTAATSAVCGTTSEQHATGPIAGHPGGKQLNMAELAVLRTCLPNIDHIPDELLMRLDPAVLVELNKASQPAGSSDMQSIAAQAAAAAAAHYALAPQQHRETDPGVKMARNLEALRDNPAEVLAGLDDRCQTLHNARFLGGSVCSAKKLWLAAREALCLEGISPLSNYDLASTGLGGCVTARGWQEIHTPGSTQLTLKLFSSSNMTSSTTGTRRLTLADGDSAISIGEHMKDIADLAELKHAIWAVCRATHFALPWNHSFNAIEGFLHTTNFAATELNSKANRASILSDFVNYIFGLNAGAWQQKESFLSTGEIKTLWGEWYGSRPASLFIASQADSSGQGPAT